MEHIKPLVAKELLRRTRNVKVVRLGVDDVEYETAIGRSVGIVA